MRALYLSSRDGASRGLDTEINLISKQIGWSFTTHKGSTNIEKMQDIVDELHFSDALIIDFLSPNPFAFQAAGIAQGLGKTLVIIVDADKPFPQPFAYRYSTVIIIDKHSNALFIRSSLESALKSGERLVKEFEDAEDLIHFDIKNIGTKSYNDIVKKYIEQHLCIERVRPQDKRIKFENHLGSFKGLYRNDSYEALVFSSYRPMSISEESLDNFRANIAKTIAIAPNISKIYIFTTESYDPLLYSMISIISPGLEVEMVTPDKLAQFVLSEPQLRDSYTTSIDFNTGYRRISSKLQILKREEAKSIPTIANSKSTTENDKQEDTWHTISLAVAHKIGNPINTLSTDGKLLSKYIENNEPKEKIKLVVDRIKATSNQAHQILRQFKNASSAFTVSVSSHDISKFTKDLQDKYRHEVEIACTTESEGKAIFDRDKIIECFDELVANSMKCNDSKIKIKILVTINEHYLDIIYEDNGVGIPVDKKEEIFELWSTFRKDGQGIGMWTVRRIISSHGGTIKENGTNGARFAIRLPIYGG